MSISSFTSAWCTTAVPPRLICRSTSKPLSSSSNATISARMIDSVKSFEPTVMVGFSPSCAATLATPANEPSSMTSAAINVADTLMNRPTGRFSFHDAPAYKRGSDNRVHDWTEQTTCHLLVWPQVQVVTPGHTPIHWHAPEL